MLKDAKKVFTDPRGPIFYIVQEGDNFCAYETDRSFNIREFVGDCGIRSSLEDIIGILNKKRPGLTDIGSFENLTLYYRYDGRQKVISTREDDYYRGKIKAKKVASGTRLTVSAARFFVALKGRDSVDSEWDILL